MSAKNDDNKKYYARRRARGLPSWRAEGRSLEAQIRRLDDDKQRSRRRNAEGKNRIACLKYMTKMIELYGGRISTNTEARLRWLIAKNAKS